MKGTMSPSLLNIFDLKEILEKIFIEFFENNKQLFLVDLDVDSFKIDVKIDGDNGVKVSDCVLLSKHIKKHFDTELDDFSLNVSSAGLLSPLIT
jgi:ribosome maturation factor RimP